MKMMREYTVEDSGRVIRCSEEFLESVRKNSVVSCEYKFCASFAWAGYEVLDVEAEKITDIVKSTVADSIFGTSARCDEVQVSLNRENNNFDIPRDESIGCLYDYCGAGRMIVPLRKNDILNAEVKFSVYHIDVVFVILRNELLKEEYNILDDGFRPWVLQRNLERELKCSKFVIGEPSVSVREA